MEKKVLTEEEMKQISSLRIKFDELVFKVGMNEVQQMGLKAQNIIRYFWFINQKR
jgi:hypothetical protein